MSLSSKNVKALLRDEALKNKLLSNQELSLQDYEHYGCVFFTRKRDTLNYAGRISEVSWVVAKAQGYEL